MRLLNMKETSQILSISIRTLYQWRWKRQHLPFVKVGKTLRVSEKDLTDFIEKRKEKPKRA